MAEDDNLVTIREYSTSLEAEWALNVLAQAGICALLPDRELSSLIVPAIFGRVQVPASAAKEAEEILSTMEMHRKLLAEEEREPESDAAAVPEAGGTEQEDVEALDPHDLCPAPNPIPCPSCGHADTEPVVPPSYAGENRVVDAIRRFAGHGWRRCESCGHEWTT